MDTYFISLRSSESSQLDKGDDSNNNLLTFPVPNYLPNIPLKSGHRTLNTPLDKYPNQRLNSMDQQIYLCIRIQIVNVNEKRSEQAVHR
jgi:hypothetical protein